MLVSVKSPLACERAYFWSLVNKNVALRYRNIIVTGKQLSTDISAGNVDRSHVGLSHAVAQLVHALRYKPEGRGFDTRRCH
jgi:predicted HAD superfamily phosphohydrolase YqeG